LGGYHMGLSPSRIMGFCFLRSWMGLLFFCSAMFQAYDGTVQWRAANDVFVS